MGLFNKGKNLYYWRDDMTDEEIGKCANFASQKWSEIIKEAQNIGLNSNEVSHGLMMKCFYADAQICGFSRKESKILNKANLDVVYDTVERNS